MEIREVDPAVFDRFVRACPDSFHNQSVASAKVNLAQGMDTRLLGLYDGDKLLAVTKVSFLRWRRFFKTAELYYGPIFREQTPELMDQFLTAFLAYLRRQLRVIRLRFVPLVLRATISDDLELEENPAAEAYDQVLAKHGLKRFDEPFTAIPGLQPDFMYVKDMAGITDEESLMDSLTVNGRNNIRKAQRFAVQVRNLAPDEVHIFADMLEETIERTGMPEYIPVCPDPSQYEYFGEDMLVPLAYIAKEHSLAMLEEEVQSLEAELAALEEEKESRRIRNRKQETRQAIQVAHNRAAKVKKFCAEHGDVVPLAVAQFFITPSDFIYLHSASYSEAFIFEAVFAIHEVMLKKALERGVKRYNMFGINNPLAPENADNGVIAFKRNFNGYSVQLLGNYELNRF